MSQSIKSHNMNGLVKILGLFPAILFSLGLIYFSLGFIVIFHYIIFLLAQHVHELKGIEKLLEGTQKIQEFIIEYSPLFVRAMIGFLVTITAIYMANSRLDKQILTVQYTPNEYKPFDDFITKKHLLSIIQYILIIGSSYLIIINSYSHLYLELFLTNIIGVSASKWGMNILTKKKLGIAQLKIYVIILILSFFYFSAILVNDNPFLFELKNIKNIFEGKEYVTEQQTNKPAPDSKKEPALEEKKFNFNEPETQAITALIVMIGILLIWATGNKSIISSIKNKLQKEEEILFQLEVDAILKEPYQRKEPIDKNDEMQQIKKQAEKFGKEEGEKIGKEEGIKKGYQEGLEKGLTERWGNGVQKGLEQGLHQGFTRGFDEGYNKGCTVTLSFIKQKMKEEKIEDNIIDKITQNIPT